MDICTCQSEHSARESSTLSSRLLETRVYICLYHLGHRRIMSRSHNGRLCKVSIHRVVFPGPLAQQTRNGKSIAYFSTPDHNVVMNTVLEALSRKTQGASTVVEFRLGAPLTSRLFRVTRCTCRQQGSQWLGILGH